MMLTDLPELLLVLICQFYLEKWDYSDGGGWNEFKSINSSYSLVLNYQLVNNQFKNIVHMTTRDDAYIGLCQYMYLNTIIPNTSFTAGSDPYEDYELGDLVVFDISPYDDSWSDQSKWSERNEKRDPRLCRREDLEGIVKILTLNKKYALGKVRISSADIEQWLLSVIDLLAGIVEENPEVSIHTEIIEIGWCGDNCNDPNIGFWQRKSWEGDTTVNDWDWSGVGTGENCIKAVTTFVNLVKQLSSNKCNFGNGLSCIQCSAINLYYEIPFTADMNKDSYCYYCDIPILPNSKCIDCYNYCRCKDEGNDFEDCKGFCCNDCEVSNQIKRQTWRAPNCQYQTNDENEE